MVLYLINVILNITATDIVESYKENVDEDIDYDRTKLLTFNYICLTFGVVTIILSAAYLVKFSESEDFVHFMVKWNIVRCFFVFIAIIYAAVDMNHILTASLSSVMLTIDLCASTYFTGIMASYIKLLEDPNGEVYSSQQRNNKEPAVYLVSHKKSLHTEQKVSYDNEVANRTDGFVEIPLNNEPQKDTETYHNSMATTDIKNMEKENCTSTTSIDEGDDADQKFNTKLQQLGDTNANKGLTRTDELQATLEKSASNCTRQEGDTDPLGKKKSSETNSETISQETNEIDEKSGDDTKNPKSNEITENDPNESEETEATVGDANIRDQECENQDSENQQKSGTDSSDVNGIENLENFSENSCDEKGIENPAVDLDVSESEPPSVVIIPASPDQEVELGLEKDAGEEGKENSGFEGT